jgi:hypothetical protein
MRLSSASVEECISRVDSKRHHVVSSTSVFPVSGNLELDPFDTRDSYTQSLSSFKMREPTC